MTQRHKARNKMKVFTRKRGRNMSGGFKYLLGRSGKRQLSSTCPSIESFTAMMRMLFKPGGDF